MKALCCPRGWPACLFDPSWSGQWNVIFIRQEAYTLILLDTEHLNLG